MVRNLAANGHQSETKYLVELSDLLSGMARRQAGQSDGEN
jgi:hypothetical protein